MNTSHQAELTIDNDLVNTTWGERFLLNLLSYSLVLVPVGIIVLATRYRLCPTTLQSSSLVQWFVNGCDSTRANQRNSSQDNEDSKRLIIDENNLADEKEKTIGERSNFSALQFIWCFVGLQVSYLTWGILQEKIMTTVYNGNGMPIRFHDSQFLVFLNRIIGFILSIVALLYNRTSNRLKQQSKPQAPLYEYIYCSLSNILSSWCQYEALKYVSFPTQVLSKSCKIVAVMLMSKLILNKKYHLFDYMCALLLSVGMFVFILNQPATIKDSTSQHLGNNSEVSSGLITSGLIILGLYLTFDSFTSNWQQSIFSRYSTTQWQMMAAINFYSILLTLTSLHQLGTLRPAFRLLASSTSLLIDCLMMSIMSSIGQLFVYYTIKRFGSVLFTVIMTLRQFLAILLSCTIYGHRLSLGSMAGLSVVFFVLGLQMWRKWGSSSATAKAKQSLNASSRIHFEATSTK